MPEYRDEPKEFAEPTRAEIRARSGRNIAIALGLVIFLVLIAVSIVLRQPA
jgi:tetrahydromethanopterin S-methyltransferase subunit G